MKKLDYKWGMLALVSAAYFLAQGTRNVYGAVLPSIGADLGLSNAARGAVATAFFATFGLMIPLAGFFADFFRRKWTIVAGMALFSSAILATGFANGFLMLLIAYGVVNSLGQCLMPPSNSSLIGQLHVETRSRAFAVYQTTFYVGIVVCCCVGGGLAGLGAGGWRWAFKGGKGVATTAGCVMALSPTLCGVALGVWVLMMALTRYVSLSSMVAAVAMVLLGMYEFWWADGVLGVPDMMLIGLLALICVLVIVKHRSNIVRLCNGSEPKAFSQNSNQQS